MMFTSNIEEVTINNTNYREVLHTTPQMQLVIMSLQPKQDIGIERHKNATQFIKVEAGNGIAILYDKQQKNPQSVKLTQGSSVMIHANTFHNIVAGKKGLQLYTLYSPPQHTSGLIQETKQQHEDDE